MQAPKDKGTPGPAPAVARQPSNTTDGKQYPSEQSPLPVRMIESPSDAAHSKAREARSDQHDKENLSAQARAADAAEEQAQMGRLAAILSFLSVLLLVWTVRESRRSAEAAIRSAAIAEDTAKRQLRAYVNVFKACAVWSKDAHDAFRPVSIVVYTKNSGQTPANKVTSWAASKSSESPPEYFPRLQDESLESVGLQGPGQINHFTLERPLVLGVESEISRWSSGKESLYVWGEINYTDAFGADRTTKFRLVMPKEGVRQDGGKFTSCSQGNEAT